MRQLWRELGLLQRVATEYTHYETDLVGVQEVSCDGVATQPVVHYTYLQYCTLHQILLGGGGRKM